MYEGKKKVLIFPAGTEIAFEIVNALKYSKFVEIYGGTSTVDHSEFVYRNLIEDFPFVDHPDFLRYLNKVIDEYKIDCLYPAHDSVCVFFSEHRAQINAQVIVTEKETVQICRSKKKTYDFFSEFDFIPKTYDMYEQIEKYPVFVKPSVGQGSKGAKKINNYGELNLELQRDANLVICEYLSGEEYTVDCFTDRFGNLRSVKQRNRQRIRAGISVRTENIEVADEIEHMANILNENLVFRGAWFFQVKKNDEQEYRLLEVSPRIPGTMGLSRNMGINYPLLTLFDFWGYDIDIDDNDYDIILDRAFYSAYQIGIQYEHIYLDYDDTIIVNGRVNLLLLIFLYQAIEKGKRIHLITKHSGNLKNDMVMYHIPSSLFEEIVIIDRGDEKYNYIHEQSAIFIDDSFAERQKIKKSCKIPVFDIDMIECLIDWRY